MQMTVKRTEDIEASVEAALEEVSAAELRELAAATLRLRARLSVARQNFKHKPESKEAISKGVIAYWERHHAEVGKSKPREDRLRELAATKRRLERLESTFEDDEAVSS